MTYRLFLLILLLVTCFTAPLVRAQTALTVLQITGSREQVFTLEDLRNLNQVEILTANEFVDGQKLFRGPLARDVLTAMDIQVSAGIKLTAANDYQVEIPVRELFDYNVILALEIDGKPLSLRDKGPIWVIYPMSDHAELRDPVFNSHLVWQLIKMELN